MSTDETLLSRLDRWAEQRPAVPAFIFLGDGEKETARISFADLRERALTIAAFLQTITVPRDRILLQYPPGLDFIIGFFGCLYAGRIAVPAYPTRLNRSAERLGLIVKDCQAVCALTTTAVLANRKTASISTEVEESFQWFATDQLPPVGWLGPTLPAKALAFLQYTSGSTGQPKGVRISHANILSNEEIIRVAFGHDDQSIVAGWLPLYHDMGLIGNTLQPIYLGVSCIFMPPVAFLQRPQRWLQMISRYRATTSGGPNFAYDLCVREIKVHDCHDLDLSSWTLAFNGAEPIRSTSLSRFSKMFSAYGFRSSAFYPCYGLAEATLLVTGGKKGSEPVRFCAVGADLERRRATAQKWFKKGSTLVSCGRAPTDLKVLIVHSESLEEEPGGIIGEIWIQGSSVTDGYWRETAETVRTFTGQCPGHEGVFLRTGDLGFIDKGQLFVTGRSKDLIIIRGRNLYPQDIEQTVERCHPHFHQSSAAAFSVEQDHEEHLVLAVEVSRDLFRANQNGPARSPSDQDDPSSIFRELARATREAVICEHEVRVHQICFLRPSTLPKTSSGKLQRFQIKAAWLAQTMEAIIQ